MLKVCLSDSHIIIIVLLQVVLTVAQLMWAREVTEILEGEFDRLEAMKEFESQCYTVSKFTLNSF